MGSDIGFCAAMSSVRVQLDAIQFLFRMASNMETGRCFIAVVFQLCCGTYHLEGPGKLPRMVLERYMSVSHLHCRYLLGKNMNF